MTSVEKNITLVGSRIPAQIKLLREHLHLTKSELGAKAGLSYRTIHEMEAGRRNVVLEKTIMLLASALEVSYEDLVSGNDLIGGVCGNSSTGRIGTVETSTRPNRSRWLLPLISLTVLLILFLGIRDQALHRCVISFEDGKLSMVNDFFNSEIWHHQWESKIRFCKTSPWSADILLVGLMGQFADGGRLLALDGTSGDILWEVRPDLKALKRAFGNEVIDAANFNCQRFVTPDIDGDGIPELVVYFEHSIWYPASICLVDQNGNMKGHYANCGHLNDLVVVDLDQDGKDEVLAAGSNNSKAYQGGTLILLDEDHFSGASIDPCTHPESCEPDYARVRLVFPQFPQPFMDQMKTPRLEVKRIFTNRNSDGETTLSLDVGADPDHFIIVCLDNELRPRMNSIGDSFLYDIMSSWPDSLAKGTGPADPAWRESWLASHKRFEAGDWPSQVRISLSPR